MSLITGKMTCSVLGLVSFKALIEESEMKKFPDNDLLRHLRLVTQDAEKCASVAQQLLNGKRQTRYLFLTV
jgi:histone demethylase JARID1